MKRRWWKRLWLRYLYYCKEHWIIAASLSLTLLWILWEILVAFLPFILQIAMEVLVEVL